MHVLETKDLPSARRGKLWLVTAATMLVALLGALAVTGCQHAMPQEDSSLIKAMPSAVAVDTDYNVFSSARRILSHATTTTAAVTSGPDTLATETLPPLFPVTWRDCIGLTIAVIGLVLAAGGGLGGGGILVPVYVLILQVPVKRAIPLSSVTVFGGAIVNNVLNFPKKHPHLPHASCVDWEFILQMGPMTMAGALLGAHLNVLLPELLIVVLLFLVLTFTAYTTLEKAMSLYKKESQALQMTTTETASLTTTSTLPANTSGSYGTTGIDEEDPEEEVGNSYNGPSEFVQLLKLTALFIVITIMNLLKGGTSEIADTSSTAGGKFAQWIPDAVILLVILLFALYIRHEVLSRLEKYGDKGLQSEIVWNAQNTLAYPGIAVLAGLAAGLFGVGGGIVFAPLMLALNMNPTIASVTTACIVLFTSLTATISYSAFGLLVYDYALVCLIMGCLATWAGQTIMAAVMKRSKRNSYIAFSVGIVVAVSALCLTVQSFITWKHSSSA